MAEDNLQPRNFIAYDSVDNYLFKVNAVDSEGKPLADGHGYVYSYLEEKIVGEIKLDDNGRATFNYQPDKSIVEKAMSDKCALDVQYAVFIGNGKEVFLDGFTQTYYTSDFFDDEYVIKVNDSITTDARSTFEVRTEVIENLDNVKVFKADDIQTNDYSTMGVVESRRIGSRATDFVTANVAVGSKAGTKIEKSTRTTIKGSGIITGSFTGGSISSVSQETPVATVPFRHVFYTFYDYTEERHQYNDMGYIVEFYQLRATKWNGGIDYASYYEPKNAVSPDSVNWINYYGYNSHTRLDKNNSYTIGVAANLTGIISGEKYEVSLTHIVSSSESVWRYHADNTRFYEYGGGLPIINKYVTRY